MVLDQEAESGVVGGGGMAAAGLDEGRGGGGSQPESRAASVRKRVQVTASWLQGAIRVQCVRASL